MSNRIDFDLNRMSNYQDELHNSSSIRENTVAQQFQCDDATLYLNEVRLAKREKYEAFVSVMKDFIAQRIDSVGVRGLVNDLFKEYPDLNYKFTKFFPKSDDIVPNAKKEPLPGIVIAYDEALSLTSSIMERFSRSGNHDVIESFMDKLEMFINGKISFINVTTEVQSLFTEHPDLVHKFCIFLPVSSGEMKRLRDDAMYLNPKPIGTSGVVAVNGETASEQKRTHKDAFDFLSAVKFMFQGQREKYNEFVDIMKDFKNGRVDRANVIGQVKELFRGYPSLITGFNTFLPKGYELCYTEEEEEEAPQKRTTIQMEDAINFVCKVKQRFTGGNDHVYRSFLNILHTYRAEQKSIVQVSQEVSTLFEDHPDLVDEFTRFLPESAAAAFRTRCIDQGYEKTSSAMTSLLVSAAIQVQSYNFCCLILSKL